MNKYVNAIRSLGLQAILSAKQGHPGMTISAAPINYAVYTRFLNISKTNANWINRDRFVLSGGHGSMSLYPILHFAGLLSIDEIKNFRQENSLTPGHPESYLTPYIDATTGPLGQGISNGVGMAIAEEYLSHQYSQLKGLIDHYTYIVCGDGDLQEGISYESMSLAGRLKLHKLIILYDSNNYQLESSVSDVNIENIQKRVESMNWYYQESTNDIDQICECIQNAKNQIDKPSFIEIKTKIGEGLSFANSAEAHGGTLTNSELDNFNNYFKCNFNDWNFNDDIYHHFYESIINRGEAKYQEWLKLLDQYKQIYPELTLKFLKQINNEFIDIKKIININELPKNTASRIIAGNIIKQLQDANVKDTMILSPDISKSTGIKYSGPIFNNDKNSNMILVGIREFAMSGIQNGILLHRGLRCICSSFLSFSDYFKAGIRLGAINRLNSIYIFTHDSVQIGSDGPTHQPVDQLSMLRAIPNVEVIRPCDEYETLAGFIEAFNSTNKTYCLILSRQNLVSNYATSIDQSTKFGGYCILDNSYNNQVDYTILASGSEVDLAIKVSNDLIKKYKLTSQVYSVPNLNRFVNQDNSFLSKSKYGLISIEASNDNTWYKLANYGYLYAQQINNYGKSMDGLRLYQQFGFQPIYIIYHALNQTIKENKLLDLIKSEYILESEKIQWITHQKH